MGERGPVKEVYVLGLIFAVSALRLIYASALPLTADEAYYWQWSRHLAWGYYDHPPVIAYLIAAGTGVAGINPLGVRIMSVILAGATAWMVYRLVADSKLNHRFEGSLWALGLTLCTPLLSVGAVLATPDAPMVFFWTSTVWGVQKALNGSGRKYWLVAGLAMGLGMLSKFPMAILPAALVLAMAGTRKGRNALFSSGPWLAGFLAVALCVPYILWSTSRGFGSVFYQLGHGLGKSAGGHGSGSFLIFIGGQLAVTGFLVFPVVMFAMVKGLKGWLDRSHNDDQRLVFALWTAPAVLTLFVFGAASFLAKSSPNWPVAMYPTSFALAGMMIAGFKQKGRILTGGFICLALLMSLYVQLETIRPLVPYNPRGFFSKVQDRKEFAQWAEGIRAGLGDRGKDARILADSYQLASLLAFYLPDHPETDSPRERGSGSAYAQWRKGWKGGEWALFFTRKGRIPDYLSEPEKVGSLTEKRLGRKVDVISAQLGRLEADGPRDR